MEGLINQSLNKKDIERYINENDMPIRNTVALKPAISFATDLHSILYKTSEERDEDYNTLIEMY